MDHNDARELIAEIQALEDKAHRRGFTETAHALNEAKNKAGWEYAGKLERESRIAYQRRPTPY